MTHAQPSRRPPAGRRLVGRALAATAMTAGGLAWLSAAAAPAGASEATQTVTFTTPGESTYSIPAGTVSLAFTLVGAPGAPVGGNTGQPDGTAGQGAQLQATLAPSALPADTTTLYVEVGSSGGTYGGGASAYGEAGGGEAAVETCSAVNASCTYTADPSSDPRLLVAGGGGGGGENSFASGTGGSGGNAGSSTASGPGAGGAGTDAGNGLNGADGGAAVNANQAPAGPGSSNCSVDSGTAANGSLGLAGAGGAGGNGANGNSSTGGGGGGGWVGGSGGGSGDCPSSGASGGSGGGGGAGASFSESAATGVTLTTAAAGATPEVSITATIDFAPTITSPTSTTFTAGKTGSFTVTASGSPSPALAENGALPSGVTFTDNGDGTATLAGAAAAGTGGTYPITITATNSLGSATPQNFTLTVDEAPSITSGAAATFVVGQSGTTFSVTTGGYPAPAVTDGGTTLPSGLTLKDNGNGTATLSGTPGAGTSGVYHLYLFADNGLQPGASQAFVLTVDQSPSITSADTAVFSVGQAGSFTVTTSGFPSGPAISLSDSNATLPGGVTFHDNGDGTATISGTPAPGTGGLYSFNITATSSVAPPAVQSFSLGVQQAPAFSSAASATFVVGSAANFTVATTGFPLASVSESGALPSGVTLSSRKGGMVFGGQPAAGTGGVYPLTFTASNGILPNATQAFKVTVDQAPAITSSASATFRVGATSSFNVTTTGFPVSAIAESGKLPAGVTFVDGHHGTATLSGRPSSLSGGIYHFTVVASNGVSPAAAQSFTLSVLEAPVFTSAPTVRFALGQPGSFTVTTAAYPGGAAVHISLSGALPAGLGFRNNGNGTATISGTAADTDAVSFPVTLSATNGPGTSVQHLTVLVVTGPGYVLLAQNGGVLSFDGSHFEGSLPSRGIKINDMIGAAETLDGRGYWLVDGVGGVFNFGDAKAFGLAGKPLNLPVVGVVPTPDDGGYWLIARDGGVFSYGDARYFGSLPASHINVNDVVGMVSTLDGRGYYIALSTGAVYAFGDAAPRGGVARPGSAIVGIAFDRATGGYWLVSANGSVFGFDARYYGGTPTAGAIIGITPSSDAGGYLLLAKNGTVYGHGDAPAGGPLPRGATDSPVVAISSP